MVPADSFSFAQLHNIPTGTILGRSSADTGDVEALPTVPTVISAIAHVDSLEIGRDLAGDRSALIDFHSAGTPGAVDHHARIIRHPGINGTMEVANIGAGAISLVTGSGGLWMNGFPSYACRAWVNFDGTGAVAIRASGNVSSITDNGVGDYTVNFATAMPDANYAINCTSQRASDHGAAFSSIASAASPTASAVRVIQKADSGGLDDPAIYCVSIFR